MWSKLGKNLATIFQKNKKESDSSPNSTQFVELAIKEIDQAIQKNQITLDKTVQNLNGIASQLQQFKAEAENLYKEAMKAVKNKRDDDAKVLLQKKSSVDSQLQQYHTLYQNVWATVKQLENQIEKLKWQKEEIKAKETILTAKLENAQTQKELQQSLKELDETGQFNLFEEEVLKMQMEADLTNDILSLEREFEQLDSPNQVEFVKKDIEKQQIEEQNRKDEQQLKKLNLLFGQNASQEAKVLAEKKTKIEQKKQNLLNELIQSQHQSAKTDAIDDFFNQSPTITQNLDIQSNEISASQQDLVDDFFKEDEKQKKINDFFKD
jgi:phage shock protein A